jgi:hypothetical protein
MEKPPPPRRLKPKSAPKLVIDKNGETDKNRYTGLKMGQVLDDGAMAKALEEANRKVKQGMSLRKKIAEEDYIMPFAGKFIRYLHELKKISLGSTRNHIYSEYLFYP